MPGDNNGVSINSLYNICLTKIYQQLATEHWQTEKTNDVIFLDLKKDFDTVYHDILLEKLSCYGFRDKELSLFQSYLFNRSQCYSVNGKISGFMPIACGVPQASILRPLLFIIYMNDLQNITSTCDVSMYADETHLSSAMSYPNDINVKLIPEFVKICDWLQANKLSLNILKTEHMVIGTEQMLAQMGSIPKIKIDSSYLKRVVKTKSLRLIIDDNLRKEDHMDKIGSKTKRKIGIISRTKGVIPTGSSIQLYKSLVEPYFRYGNTVWDLCNDNLIDELQLLKNRVARIITDTSYDSADHPLLLIELGWFKIRRLIMFDLGIFTFKIYNGRTPQSVDNILNNICDIRHYQTRGSLQDNYFRIPINKQISKTAISYSGPSLWDDILGSIRDSPSLETLFYKKISRIALESKTKTLFVSIPLPPLLFFNSLLLLASSTSFFSFHSN